MAGKAQVAWLCQSSISDLYLSIKYHYVAMKYKIIPYESNTYN